MGPSGHAGSVVQGQRRGAPALRTPGTASRGERLVWLHWDEEDLGCQGTLASARAASTHGRKGIERTPHVKGQSRATE
jgi:hypothetical protein